MRGPLQMYLKRMGKFTPLLSQLFPAGGRDRKIAGGYARLRGGKLDHIAAETPLLNKAAGMPKAKRMKCASWICKSTSGPPTIFGSQKSLSHVGSGSK